MSKFKVWIESPSVGQIESYSTFEGEQQRIVGFSPNTKISSRVMNSILRQSSLVTAALMDICDPNGSTSLESTLEDVKSLIKEKLDAPAKLYLHSISSLKLSFISTSSERYVSASEQGKHLSYFELERSLNLRYDRKVVSYAAPFLQDVIAVVYISESGASVAVNIDTKQHFWDSVEEI